MDNQSYIINGVSIFDNDPIETAIVDNPSTVKIYGDQTIAGNKSFTGTVTIENEIIHNSTTFSTKDGIIHQLRDNTGDMLDYGTYADYDDGTGPKYKGFINKKQTDKFYVFHNQTTKPETSLNLNTQNLGTIVVRDPVDNNEVATKGYVESHGGGSYLPLSGGTMSGDINMNNNRLTNLNGGVAPADAVNRAQLDTKFDKSGGTMTGQLSMNNNRILNIALTPILGREATCKDYVDGLINGRLSINGGTMSGDINLNGNDLINCDVVRPNGISLNLLSQNQAGGMRIFNTLLDIFTDIRLNTRKITFLGEPTASSDAATKQYVDNAVNGGGDVHLPKYHTTFDNPTPDSGQNYKTYTNNGFEGQLVFDCQSPVISTSTGYVLWNINIPPLFFMDNLVDFYIKIKESGTLVETIQSGATYNGFVGTGFNTVPNITKGCHEFQTSNPTTIFSVEVWAKPNAALNATSRLLIPGAMNRMYRVFDTELININP